MPMKQVEQKTFETGEVGADHLFRADLAVRAKSLRRARNVRILVSGALEARPGTERIHTAPGDGYVRDMVIQETAYVLLLTDQRLDVFDRMTRGLIQSVTGCPWTLTMLTDENTPLVVDPYDDEARVFHPTMPEQVIKRSTAGVWSVAADTPAAGIGGAKRQPYYRFADRGVSLTPSDTAGSITLTASAAYFVPEPVGVALASKKKGVNVCITTVRVFPATAVTSPLACVSRPSTTSPTS